MIISFAVVVWTVGILPRSAPGTLLVKKPYCRQHHTTLLRPPDSFVLPSVEEVSNPSSDVTVKSGFAGVNNKPSPIVPVKVKLRNKQKYVTTQALLDSGSTNSFIAHDLIRQLEINETPIFDVNTQMIQSAPEKRKAQLVANIEICDMYESGCLSLHPLLSLPSIPASPNDALTQEDIKEYDEFRDICIETVNTDVGLLIGNDNRHILQPVEVINSEEGHYAIKTHVSWVISCPSKTGSPPSYYKNFLIKTNNLLVHPLCTLCLDLVDIVHDKNSLSRDQARFIDLVSDSIRHCDNSH